jgi:hypothetical protein
MHERAASITPGARAVAWCTALLLFWCTTPPARGQGTASLEYAAPAECPAQAEFVRRLARRLPGAPPPGGSTLKVSVARTEGPRYRGRLTLTDDAGLVGQRTIEARSCGEAVDALAFVAALLHERRAQAAPRSRARVAAPRAGGDARAVGSSAPDLTSIEPGESVGANTRADDPAAASSLERRVDPAADTSTAGGEGAATSPVGARMANGDAPRPASTSAAVGDPPRSARASGPLGPGVDMRRALRPPVLELAGSVALGGLLVSGVAPALRPGLDLRATGYARHGRRAELALSLGLRATLRHDERSAEGTGRFAWWSATFAACGALRSSLSIVPMLCAVGEAGRIVAGGRATEAPRRARVPWRALGVALRLRVPIAGPVWLAPGLELLWPATRDRFVVAERALHRVPWLTFRAELAVGVHWP